MTLGSAHKATELAPCVILHNKNYIAYSLILPERESNGSVSRVVLVIFLLVPLTALQWVQYLFKRGAAKYTCIMGPDNFGFKLLCSELH